MRSLTKSGIRELTAKYRSVLKKCALLNAMLLMLGASSAMADTPSLPEIIQSHPEIDSYTLTNNETMTSDLGTLAGASRSFTINGNGNTLNGKKSDTEIFAGMTVQSGQTLALNDVSMRNFKKESETDVYGGAVNNNGGTITSITGNFTDNYVSTTSDEKNAYGGAIYNNTTSTTAMGIIGNFISNSALSGGAIYNQKGNIDSIQGDFKSNSATGIITETEDGGGAIYNKEGIIDSIVGNFEDNSAYNYGGAINNSGNITDITGRFSNNRTTNLKGGAIYNTGIITGITGVDDGTDEHNIIAFDNNSAEESGGAIYNETDSTTAMNIIGDFISNSAKSGGAIYNQKGTINRITGDFKSNSTTNSDGGAIRNYGTITSITGNFSKNTAITNGGAISNGNSAETNIIADSSDITFDGNYVTTGNGGAIYNSTNGAAKGIVGLYAGAGHSITFKGDKTTQTLPDNAKDIDGIFNMGTLNINGTYNRTNYTGDVFLYNVSDFSRPMGTTNIYGGTVHFGGNYTQGATNIYGGTLNFANNKIATANLGALSLKGNANLILDADLAGDGKMDQLQITSLDDNTGTLKITDIQLLSDATQDKISLSLFADDTTKEALKNNVSGNLTGLQYSPTYIYDANYDSTTGQMIFTRTEQANPYVYAPSTMAQTTAGMVGQVSVLAMDKLDVAVADSEKGLSGGDIPKASNGWVKLMGFDDNVEFKKFDTMDSKTMTLAGGFNTDKVKFDNFDASFGVYAGYIGGRQKYTGNKIEQKGGYMGLSSELTKGNAFLLSTINGGFINNDVENMYGLDTFDTYWFGVVLKGGYNYALNDTLTLQPNVYAGYTRINTEDYTSASGVTVNTDNLNFFEVNPGFKLITQLDNEWLGFIQGKYAIVMDNGGETTVNEFVLPNISTKNYFEYGVGMTKALTDAWSLNGAINRRDGGRTGWNGSVEFKYNF